MLYGICNLSIVPLRETTSDTSEMVNQVLFGETFEVIEKEKEWSKIRLTFDNYEGFIDNKQYTNITEDFFFKLKSEKQYFSGELVDFVTDDSVYVFPNNLIIPKTSFKIFTMERDKNYLDITIGYTKQEIVKMGKDTIITFVKRADQ